MPLSGAVPTQIAPRTERWLPHAIVATAFVVLLPAVVVWTLVPRGSLTLVALSVPLGVLLSVLAAAIGTALWKRVPGSRDLVFADLMLWGWLRRLRAERRLRHAESLLGTHAEGLSVQALTDLSALLEARDTFTYGHSLRVTRHAERIAAELGLPADEIARVRTAAALHDVGKLHTPRTILNKPGRLTEEEFAVIRRHPGEGADLAGSVGDAAITRMIRHHHERLDGAGYPDGLSGGAIPLGARIIAVADTFDAMTSNRAYRRASSHKRALDVLRQEAGKQLDADAVAAFVGYYRGRRTVVWSAFAAAAPQRLFAWLGGVSPGVGVAGAAAVAIGVASPQAPVVSPAAAASRPAPKRAPAATATPAPVRLVLGDGPTAGVPRFTRRSSGTAAREPRAKRQKRDAPAGRRHKTTKRPKVEPKAAVPAPEAATPRAATPQTAAPPKPRPARPVKVKPQAAKPVPAKPAPAKPAPAKPQPQAKPDKVKPAPAPAPAPKPPKVTLPAPLPQPAPAVPKVKTPKA